MTRPCPACGTTPAPVAPEERARFLASLTSGADVLALQRRAEAAERERDALRADVRAYLAPHWTATAEMGAHDQTEASVDAAVAAEMAALDALRRAVAETAGNAGVLGHCRFPLDGSASRPPYSYP